MNSRLQISTRTVQRSDQAYPSLLRRLPDPPDQLHVRGEVGLLHGGARVAIVGSRRADVAACRFASDVSAELASRGVVIVSGGAEGIDTAAHRGALSTGGATISVIGSGFSCIYPKCNHSLFNEIERTGLLVSEYHDAQPPTKWTFPRRNRIIASLSDMVLVVQAASRSGALITARIAERLSIPVGAVPGSPGDPRNRGNHALLRDGAALVEGASDVWALLSSPPGKPAQLCLEGFDETAVPKGPRVTVGDPTALKVLDILCTSPLHIDDISHAAGLLPGETSAAILTLELLGLAEDQGGSHYVRVG